MRHRLTRLGFFVLLAGCGPGSRFEKEPEWCPGTWQEALEEGLADSLCEFGARCGEAWGDWMPLHFSDPDYQWYHCGPDNVSSFLSTLATVEEEFDMQLVCLDPCGLRDCYQALHEILDRNECPPAPVSLEEDLFENECAHWHKSAMTGEPPDYVEDCWDPWVEETW